MRTDRIWIGAGVLVAVGLALISWFLLIGPQHNLADGYDTQTNDTQTRITILRSRLAELRKQNANLATYTSQLAADQAALPSSAATADLLRNLNTIGDAKGVTVSGVIVGDATQLSAVSSQLYALPITLTVGGTAAKVDSFLSDLQTNQSRAVLLVSVAALPTSSSAALANGMTVTVDLRAFISISSTDSSTTATATPN